MTLPTIFVIEQFHQLSVGIGSHIKGLVARRTSFCPQPVYASAGFVPGISRIYVGQPAVIPVRDIHHAIGAGLDVDRTKPAIFRVDDNSQILRADGRSVLVSFREYDVPLEWIERDKIAGKPFR